MNPFCLHFFSELEQEYHAILKSFSDVITLANKMIPFLEAKVKQLHTWLKNYVFDTLEEEIYFFKELKPKLAAKLIYYKVILKMECHTPNTKILKKEYYLNKIHEIDWYNKQNKEFFEYYRSRASYRDQEYFIRSHEHNTNLDDCQLLNYDNTLCTLQDYNVAKIMSNDLLCVFLENRLEELDNSCKLPIQGTPINWTASKIDLVELVYALHHQKVFNGGNTDLKEIASYMGKMFNIELEENIYRSYLDIKNRKANPTKFLNSLSDNLINKIVSEDA
ncbi:RteC domain-containing protein [Flavobacterium oreochromis]|uniref:RteC domain-containing protein n=1 Tax=Flavobacterium oreochromis TaxID=2906078 RepID=UPI00385D744F